MGPPVDAFWKYDSQDRIHRIEFGPSFLWPLPKRPDNNKAVVSNGKSKEAKAKKVEDCMSQIGGGVVRIGDICDKNNMYNDENQK